MVACVQSSQTHPHDRQTSLAETAVSMAARRMWFLDWHPFWGANGTPQTAVYGVRLAPWKPHKPLFMWVLQKPRFVGSAKALAPPQTADYEGAGRLTVRLTVGMIRRITTVQWYGRKSRLPGWQTHPQKPRFRGVPKHGQKPVFQFAQHSAGCPCSKRRVWIASRQRLSSHRPLFRFGARRQRRTLPRSILCKPPTHRPDWILFTGARTQFHETQQTASALRYTHE
jgi:hypothetical protein